MSNSADTDIMDALIQRFELFVTAETIDNSTQVGYPGKDFKPPAIDPPISFFVLDWQPKPNRHIATHERRYRGIFVVNVFSPEDHYVDGCNILVDKVIDHYWPTDNKGLSLLRNGIYVRIGKGDGSREVAPYADAPMNNRGFIRRRVLINYYCDVDLRT